MTAEELRELSARAGDGEWFVRRRPTDEGLAVIEDGKEHGIFPITGEWHEIKFIVELVNWFRALPPQQDKL